MRIALATPEYVTEDSCIGGLANYMQRVAISLSGMGHQPVVFVSANRNETAMLRGIEVHRVDIANRWLRLLSAATQYRLDMSLHIIAQARALDRALLREHRRKPFDIVQYPHLAALGLYGPRDIPRVVRLSGYQPLWHGMGDGCTDRLQGRQQYFFEKRALCRADHVFGPSRVIADYVSKDIGRPITVIESPFVVETERVNDRVYRDRLEGTDYLIFVGTLNMLKGIGVIADMLRELLSDYPDLRFVFVGKNRRYTDARTTMDYIWEKAGTYRGRVLYLGVMTHEYLFQVLEHAVAAVLPSRIDNFPNTCLEAMGHGRMVIGTRGTSFEQLITEGESGFLCRPDDPADLLRAVRKTLELAPEERERMGERARRRADELRPEETVGRLVEFYEKAIADHRGNGNDD